MVRISHSVTDGETWRNAALNRLRCHRAAIIHDLTRVAILIALDTATVIADSMRAAVPAPDGIRPVVAGAAIRDLVEASILRHTGECRAFRRPIAHERPIAVRHLADPVVAKLAAHPPIVGGDA